MKKDILFNIQSLICAYTPNKPVLKIPSLQIFRGELLFLLGPSGVGKSTFIESLGLMNETIMPHSDTQVTFTPSDGKQIRIDQISNLSEAETAQARNTYFSFIFQENNLMPNFSAGQNMCVGKMMPQLNFSTEQAKKEVLALMPKVKLDDPDFFDRDITELSGGQQQRVAFIRAIYSQFEVIFGDEPTGNLDWRTANELMNVLKEELIESKTGIIVSHDIRLALGHADRIALLTPNIQRNENGEIISSWGEILPDSVMERIPNTQEWLHKNKKISNPESYIRTFLFST